MKTPKSIARALRTFKAGSISVAVFAASLFCLPKESRSADPTNDLFVASFATGNVTRIDGTTGAEVYSVHQADATINLAKGPDGELYVSTLFASTVVKADLEFGAPLGLFASAGARLPCERRDPHGCSFQL